MLTALSSLRRLALSSCTHLPDCLPQLTGLEALTIQDPVGCREDLDEVVVASIESMGQLTDLTHLALAHYDVEGLEVALASLPWLRSLWWLPIDPEGTALPAGHSAASRRLADQSAAARPAHQAAAQQRGGPCQRTPAADPRRRCGR